MTAASMSFNPEQGFHAFIDTVAYCLDVDPRVFGDEEILAIRQVFDRNGSIGEAEGSVRHILVRRGLIQ